MAVRATLLRLCCVIAGLWLSATALAAPPESSLRQVAGILDYIAGDYRAAVAPDGQILDEGEFKEQLSLAADADALAAQAGLGESAPVRKDLAVLAQALAERQNPGAIAELCKQARATLVQEHGLVLGPPAQASREDGARLYREQACNTCHGDDGAANTEAARALDPQPANFLDAERVAAVSPHRAYYAISFGVAGTGMQGYAHLSDAERWSLAFHVLSLRHAGADFAAGAGLLDRAGVDVPRAAAGLALLTEEEIGARLANHGSAAERAHALAYLRAQAPFEDTVVPGGNLASARRMLRDGLDAYRQGDRAAARQQFVAAYLDGFEPHEAALGARDRELVVQIERAMLELRSATASGAPLPELQRLVMRTDGLLESAERGGGDASAAMIGAFTIALREGLEVALLVTALLALARKRGAPELVRYVHAGWMLAAVAGLLTWWAASELLSGLTRELAEGTAALLAAAVLLGVTHWVFGQLGAKRFMGFVADRMRSVGTRARGAAAGVLGLSFLATYREAFELVLFYKALLLEAGDQQSRVWLGALLGLAALLVASFVLKRIGQRLQPRPFMLMSGILLALLAFVLTGKGVRAIQEAGVLDITQVAFADLPWLGVYGTLEGVSAQGAVALLLLASALWPVLSQRMRGTPPQPAE